MTKYYNIKNIFNILLFIWCISIPFKNALYQASIASILIFFIIFIIKYKDYNYLKEVCYKFKDLILVFSLIILSMTISNTINDVSKSDAWRIELMFVLRYGLLFIVLIYFYSKNFFNKKLLIIFFLISMLVQVSDGIYQSIYGFDFFKHIVSDYPGGLTGAVFYRNVFGFLMGLSLLITTIYLVNSLKKNIVTMNTIFFIILFLLFLYSTVFSYSRAVWVALFASFLMYIIINFKYLKIKHLLYILIFFIILVLIFTNVDSLLYRFNSLLSGDSSNRFEIWNKGLELIKEKLIFGWGIDSWKIHGLKDYAALHNSILEILFYTGIFGLLWFLVIIMMTFKTIIINKNWELLFIITYLCINSLFDHSIFESKIFLTILTLFMFFTYSYRVEKNLYMDNN